MRILIIDNDPKELTELKRALCEPQYDWEMVFQTTPPSLDSKQEPLYDAIVLAERGGLPAAKTFLVSLAQQFPSAVRIMLVEQGGQLFHESVGLAHQFLARPCEPKMLNEAIERAKVLRNLLANSKLRELVSQVKALPTIPDIYVDVLRELRTEDPSVVKLSYLISQDPGLCAKLMQMANSSFFGLQGNVTNPADAIFHLGMSAVKQLVLSIGILTSFENKPTAMTFNRLWNHSWATGALARKLAQREVMSDNAVENAFLCGLLHDVGKLLLATGLSAEYARVQQHHRREHIQIWQAELEILGSTHAEVGAYLLGLWGLPTRMIEAVAAHHLPAADKGKKFSLITALHVADCLDQEKRNADPFVCPSRIDMAYLRELGLTDHVEDWRKIAQNASLQKAA
jgi:putative nucleotidyltransferase with HDIG domain